MLTLVTYPLASHAGNDGETRSRLSRHPDGDVGCSSCCRPVIYTRLRIRFLRPGGILPADLSPATVTVLALFMFPGIGKAADALPSLAASGGDGRADAGFSALLHAVAVVRPASSASSSRGLRLRPRPARRNDRLAARDRRFHHRRRPVVALNADNLKRRLPIRRSASSPTSSWRRRADALSIIGAAGASRVHAFGKITLFFAAGAICTRPRTRPTVSQLNGIGRRMPWTMTAFTIAALADRHPAGRRFRQQVVHPRQRRRWAPCYVLAALFASTLLNAAYFLPIIHAAFFRKADAGDELHPHGEAPWPMVLALVTTAATVALFFYPRRWCKWPGGWSLY